MTNFFSLSFKNRIAFNYIISSSILIAVVFLFIYNIVKYSVNIHVNGELQEELLTHLDDVSFDENDAYIVQMAQWQEREHNSINVNPVFVEFYDANRKLIDKSPNLNKSTLSLFDDSENDKYINSTLNGIPVRQTQKALVNKDKVVGYLVVAMSLEDFEIVLILKNILLITYPLILIVLFLPKGHAYGILCCFSFVLFYQTVAPLELNARGMTLW